MLKKLYGYYRNNFGGYNVDITNRRDALLYVVEMASYSAICTRSLVKTDIDVQAILRFDLSSLKGCNVGITDGGLYELSRGNSLRCHDIHVRTSFIKIVCGTQKLLGRIHMHTRREQADHINLLSFFRIRIVG
jgi:hypothetical protein